MLPRTLLVIATLLFLPLNPHQERGVFAQANKPDARKFDEFEDIQFSDLMARLDNFAIQLQNEPGMRGFIVVYRTRRDLRGLSNRYAQRMKNYLVNTRGLSKERVITVDGGVASCLTQELWIVPPGTAPKPRDDAYSRVFTDTDSARKFDEFSIFSLQGEGEPGGYVYLENSVSNLEAFADALRSEPRARAYIIVYGQHYVERDAVEYAGGRRSRSIARVQLDPPGTAQKELGRIKKTLVNTYGITPSRIATLDGGYRKERMIELWIVPPGETSPIATPTSFPLRRKRS